MKIRKLYSNLFEDIPLNVFVKAFVTVLVIFFIVNTIGCLVLQTSVNEWLTDVYNWSIGITVIYVFTVFVFIPLILLISDYKKYF